MWVLSELPGYIEMIVLDVQPAFSIIWTQKQQQECLISKLGMLVSVYFAHTTRTLQEPPWLWVKQHTGPPLQVSASEVTGSYSHTSGALTCFLRQFDNVNNILSRQTTWAVCTWAEKLLFWKSSRMLIITY